MFSENTFDSRNICQPQTEAFRAILQDQYLLGVPWWAAELWVRGMAPRLCCTAGHVAAFVAPERIELRGFYMPGVTGCCRVTSGTIELQTGQQSEKRALPWCDMAPGFAFRKWEKQCSELLRTNYVQNLVSTGKVKLL